jgi:hypothetical protein
MLGDAIEKGMSKLDDSAGEEPLLRKKDSKRIRDEDGNRMEEPSSEPSTKRAKAS